MFATVLIRCAVRGTERGTALRTRDGNHHDLGALGEGALVRLLGPLHVACSRNGGIRFQVAVAIEH